METNENLLRSLKKTRNLAKIYAAHQVIRWQEELQSDMALKVINPGDLCKSAEKQEIARQDYRNFIQTQLTVGKWPDSEDKEKQRKRVIEFSETVMDNYQPKAELLFKEEIEKITAVACLGLAKIRDFSKKLKSREVKLAFSASLISVIPVACLGLNLLGDFDNNSGREILKQENTRVVETSGVTLIHTFENTGVRESAATVRPTILPTAGLKETSVPTPTETKINYYEWLNPTTSLGGNLDLSQPFIMKASEKIASVMGYGNQLQLEAKNIDVNRYNNAQQAAEAGWGNGFENPLLNIDMNTTAVEQGNNGRAIIYCHSGSVAGIEWPCNWVKNAAWYHDLMIGEEKSFIQGNEVYHFRIVALNTVTVEDYNSAARVFSDPKRPMMRDIASLIQDNNLENPGIDTVVCGGMVNGEGVSMHTHRTIMSVDLVSIERLGQSEFLAATFESTEIKNGTLQNVDTAVRNVNNYFESNYLIPGSEYSFLKSNNYFSGEEWINGSDFPVGGGACDVATLLNRSVLAYSNQLGLPYEKLRQIHGSEIWGNAVFEVSLIPHSYYPGMPNDEISINSSSLSENPDNSDFEIKINENLPNGIPLPANLSISFRIESDGNGGLRSIIESNYSTEQLRQIILMSLSTTQGK